MVPRATARVSTHPGGAERGHDRGAEQSPGARDAAEGPVYAQAYMYMHAFKYTQVLPRLCQRGILSIIHDLIQERNGLNE